MKNILFGLLILSSNLIYSTDFKVNVEKKETLESLHEQKISSLSLDEEEEDIYLQELEEEALLDGMVVSEKHSVHGWKVLKGLVGLLIGTKLFFSSGTGALFLLISPDDMLSRMLSRSSSSLSPMEKMITNRFVWLSLCSALVVFSLWILKKSATNLYEGLYVTDGTEEAISTNLKRYS